MNKFILFLFFSLSWSSLSAQNIKYVYDNLNRVTQVSYPDSSVINYSYDAAGNRTTTKTKNKFYRFDLPATNFQLSAISATCKGTADGSINITASQNLNYAAVITGNSLNNSYPFTTTQAINNLAAGTYHVCITVQGQTGYQQCYDMVITQPKDLSLFTTVDPTLNSITLNLNGANFYNIQLNGKQYTTTQNTITLALDKGNNSLSVSTDKICQGIIQKTINTSNNVPYPVPFQNVLNLNLGTKNVAKVIVKIAGFPLGNLVYSNQFENQSGVIQLDLSKLNSGAFLLSLSLDNVESVFKIIKE